MNCPKCGNAQTRTIRTEQRATEDGGYTCRRRECVSCSTRFNTFESYEPADVEAIFRNREALDLLRKAQNLLASVSI